MTPVDNGDVDTRIKKLEFALGKLVEGAIRSDASTAAGPPEASGGEAAHPKPGPWLWESLNAQDQAHLWQELRAFVAMLGRRYLGDVAGDKQLPLCWYRHPAAVETLTALMVAHWSVYFDQEHPTQELMQFHEWWLWPTLDRFERLRIFSSCRSSGHQQRRVYGPLAGNEDPEDFDAFVRAQTQADSK